MFFLRVESGEDLHRVDDVPLFLGPLPLVFLSSLQIEEASLDDELFPSDSFVESGVVELDDGIFELDVLFRVFVKELHVCKEKLGIHIVFLVEITSFRKVSHDLSTSLNSRHVAPTLWVSRVLLVVLVVVEQVAHVLTLQIQMVLDKRRLLLGSLHQFFLLFTVLLFALFMESLNSLLGNFRLFVIQRDLDFLLASLDLFDLSGAGDDDVFLVGGNVVLLGLVVECKVVLLAIDWGFALDILLGYVDPIAHAALHDTLEQEQLLLGRPIFVEKLELEVVKDHVLPDRLLVLADILIRLMIVERHPSSVTLQAHHQRLGGAPDCFVFSRSDFDTLPDISVTKTAELRADQIFEILHFFVEKRQGLLLGDLSEFAGRLRVDLIRRLPLLGTALH